MGAIPFEGQLFAPLEAFFEDLIIEVRGNLSPHIRKMCYGRPAHLKEKKMAFDCVKYIVARKLGLLKNI